MLDTAITPCESCPTGPDRAVATRGPVPARLLLLSGAPRHHEEHDGVAFASPAFGQLEEILSRVGLDPSHVHYATLIACRPPHQRPLRAEAIAACGERLDITIAAVAPEVIVLCGTDVVAALLPGLALTSGHGQLVVRGRRRYYPIRHPYAALHYQPYVQEVEDDLRRLAEMLESGRLDDEAPLEEAVAPAMPLVTVSPTVSVELGAVEPAEPIVASPASAATVIAEEAGASVAANHSATAPDAEDGPAPVAIERRVGPLRAEEAGVATGAVPDGQATDDAAPQEDAGPAQLSLF